VSRLEYLLAGALLGIARFFFSRLKVRRDRVVLATARVSTLDGNLLHIHRAMVDRHPELWAFAQDQPVVDLIADVLGPDLRFHSSKLNFKWSDGGEAVRWHQDIQAWPHTNFSVLTFGVYLEDTGPEQGPLTALPGRLLRAANRWRRAATPAAG